MVEQKVYRVAAYCRLSLADGTDNESSSIATQKTILSAYIREQGWILADFYIDDGYSGINFERPSFKRMIADIEAGKINCVITKDDCVINTRKTIYLKSSGFSLVFGSILSFLNHNRKTHNIRTS